MRIATIVRSSIATNTPADFEISDSTFTPTPQPNSGFKAFWNVPYWYLFSANFWITHMNMAKENLIEWFTSSARKN
jgi:hypothetical protein